LHIEWRIDKNVKGENQDRGNSGIFLMGRYELQVLDNYNNINKTYVNGQAGSMYKQAPPLVNVCKAPGEWQTYDIVFTAPRFSDNGSVISRPALRDAEWVLVQIIQRYGAIPNILDYPFMRSMMQKNHSCYRIMVILPVIGISG
jgi:hypothetical protein